MPLNLDKSALISLSLGGLAGIVGAVATGAFWLSSQVGEVKQLQATVTSLKSSIEQTQKQVASLQCREREINAALEHATATLEQVTVLVDRGATGDVHGRASPQLAKLKRWTENSRC